MIFLINFIWKLHFIDYFYWNLMFLPILFFTSGGLDWKSFIIITFLIQGRIGNPPSIFKFCWLIFIDLLGLYATFSYNMGYTGFLRKRLLFLKNTGLGPRNSILSDDFFPNALIQLLLLKGKLFFIIFVFSLYSPFYLLYNEIIPVLDLLAFFSFSHSHPLDLLFKYLLHRKLKVDFTWRMVQEINIGNNNHQLLFINQRKLIFYAQLHEIV